MDMRSPEQIQRDVYTGEIELFLETCSPQSRSTYDKILESGRKAGRWPNGLASMAIEDLRNMFLLCQRTVKARTAE